MSTNGNADIIIVGGGIIGASIAYFLARQGFKDITLLDRSHLGMGTTGPSVASIETLTVHPSVAALQTASIDIWQNWEERIGGDCGFNPLPVAMFVREDQCYEATRAADCARAAGIGAEALTPDAFKALYPCLNMEGVGAVYYTEDGGFADPMLSLHCLADGARRMGVTIRQNTPVTAICVEAGRVVGVQTPHEVIHAPIVVLAPGLWVESLLKPLGYTASIYLHRHFVFGIEAPPNAPRLNMLDTPLEFYSRPEQSGNLFLLGGAGTFPPCIDPDETAPGVPMEQMYTYLERLVTRVPMMEAAGLRVSTAYTGVADMTPDQQPLLGSLPIDGLFLAAGMSGVGFKAAPGIGQQMAALIAGDETARTLLYPLRPTRFSESQPLNQDVFFPLD